MTWLLTLLEYLLAVSVVSHLVLLFWRSYQASRNRKRRRAVLAALKIQKDDKVIVGLFHPYCNAGGGGERVLWTAVACLQREEPNVICVIYSGDTDASKVEIVAKVEARFSIRLDPKRMHLAYLKSRHLVEDTAWKRFTLLGQSLGSIVLAYQAMQAIIPDIFIDTMGYAFTFPLVKLYARIPVGAYVHYPTISTDMLERVKQRTSGHTNKSSVATSSLLTNAKLVYYHVFAWMYSLCLRTAEYVMVNSSWTQAHVDEVLGIDPSWKRERSRLAERASKIVYPPCDTKSLASLPLEDRENLILSVAQFRPEKEHAMQLRAFSKYLSRGNALSGIKLVMAGSVRNAGDEARVEDLRALAKYLGIAQRVDFVINPPFPELLRLFGRASIGLSTMVDEHFGISVVEFMAAGLIPLVHASGGPLLDIVTVQDGQRTGYHARTVEDYANAISEIAKLTPAAQLAIRYTARSHAAAHFSEAGFEKGWMQAWQFLVAKSSHSVYRYAKISRWLADRSYIV